MDIIVGCFRRDRKMALSTSRCVQTTQFVFPCLLAIVICACSSDLPGRPIDQDARAITVAEEVVSGLVQLYADEHWEGEARAYRVDEHFIDGIGNPQLEDGLRYVAKQLPFAETDAWTLRFMGLRAIPQESGMYSLAAYVVDLHLEYCCHLIGARLTKSEDGWLVENLWSGGFADETQEAQRQRLLKRAEALR